tara:strand:- start:111 stop:452 length:342 start_codon:yes stop_codon:yes gene_type:complete
VFNAGEGAGQSGSFFFFSEDKKFLIKTMRGSEKQKMLEMVDEMIAYLKENNNQSLIARIYGIFTIKTNVFKSIDFLIMQNTAQSICSESINLVFDFKGNTRKRKLAIDNNKHL